MKIILDGVHIGNEDTTQFPGEGEDCITGVVISHDVMVFPEHTGKGLGQRAHAERLARLKHQGYNHAYPVLTQGVPK